MSRGYAATRMGVPALPTSKCLSFERLMVFSPEEGCIS